MKKHEAVDAIDQAGQTIHDLNARAWTTALNPTQNGWGPALLGVVAIPVMNLASIGHLVTSAVVRQVSPGVIETVTELGRKKDD
jgi:hypothetical protein